MIAECIERGVTFCVVLQCPHNWSKFMRGMLSGQQADELRVFKVLIESLEKIGAHVELREKIHAKLLIIDEEIMWEGSLNFLSHHETTEHVRRSVNRREVNEVRKRHKLNDCNQCIKVESGDNGRLVEFVVQRRQALGLSQGEMAKALKASQSLISRIEAGKVTLTRQLFQRMLDHLNLRIMLVPAHLCNATATFINKALEDGIAKDI